MSTRTLVPRSVFSSIARLALATLAAQTDGSNSYAFQSFSLPGARNLALTRRGAWGGAGRPPAPAIL